MLLNLNYKLSIFIIIPILVFFPQYFFLLLPIRRQCVMLSILYRVLYCKSARSVCVCVFLLSAKELEGGMRNGRNSTTFILTLLIRKKSVSAS